MDRLSSERLSSSQKSSAELHRQLYEADGHAYKPARHTKRDRSRSRDRGQVRPADRDNRGYEQGRHDDGAMNARLADERRPYRSADEDSRRPGGRSAPAGDSSAGLASKLEAHGREDKHMGPPNSSTAVADEETTADDDPDAAMAAILGFTGFDSTKGKAVEDNQKGPAKGAAKQVLQRKYRQYMNRVGGFNRFLDAMK